MAAIDYFISAPSEELLDQLTKEQLLSLASHYDIEIASGDKRLKESLREALKAGLAEGGILRTSALPAYQHQLVLPQMSDAVLEFRLKELAFRELELEDKEKERILKERQMHLEERRMHLEHERFLKELEFKHAALSSSSSASAQFSVARNIRLVPPFAEKNVERYFAHFERVATVSDWPIHAWTSLLQSVLVGKAQDAYASLNIEDVKDYEKVKGAILRTYELVPEAYRQRFRGLSKLDEQTYVEFAREKEISFSSWCKSQKAETKEDLRQLVLLEDFKNCLPVAVCTYLNQQEVSTLVEAAVLADKFVLTLKVNFDSDQGERRGRTGFNRSRFPTTSSTCSKPPPTVSTAFVRRSANVSTPLERTCFYCKNSGHFIADCPVLSKKQESYKPVALLKTVSNWAVDHQDQPAQKSELPGSSSFLMDGCVSLVTDPSTKQPIKIWRDSGALQSLILQELLPFSEQSKLGSSVLVQGFG
uniref:CCHC-type domain-containing protein n=1 Tax=Gadus morhua TaxID=8049 RepID=A0A8C5CMP6_GADMO